MSPVVRIRDDTWKRLQAFAVPLEDSVDDVINKIIDLATDETRLRGSLEQRAPAPNTDEAGASSRRDNTSAGKAARPRSQRRELTAVVLRAHGVIGPGTRIGVVPALLPSTADPEDRLFTAKFANNVKNVVWDYDGQEYSLSRLTMNLAARYQVRAGKDSENGFRVWGLRTAREVPLEERRKELEGRAQ